MWYTKTFSGSKWICPNTTSIRVDPNAVYLAANVYSCEYSATLDQSDGTTAYSDQTCKTQEETEQYLDKFQVEIMTISDTFNPYTYYETGQMQTTTRFDGQYWLSSKANYIYQNQLNN